MGSLVVSDRSRKLSEVYSLGCPFADTLEGVLLAYIEDKDFSSYPSRAHLSAKNLVLEYCESIGSDIAEAYAAGNHDLVKKIIGTSMREV